MRGEDLPEDVERRLGVLRALHVDANEIAELGRPADDELKVLPAEIGVDVQSQLGQLQRDGRLGRTGSDLLEAPHVSRGRLLGERPVGDAFSQQVEGDPEACLVEPPRHDESFFAGVPGHEPRGHSPGVRHSEQEALQLLLLTEKQQRLAQHCPCQPDMAAWRSSRP